MNAHFSSQLLQRAVDETSRLPGIGRKTALRLVLHLLRDDAERTIALAEALVDLRRNIHYCSHCHNICDNDICDICANPKRDITTICVVENIQDVMAIEATQQYHGIYHVLGGIISPMDGIGPSDLHIPTLLERVEQGSVREIILALPPSMEGDTTGYFLYRKLTALPAVPQITVLARGIAQNDELQYTDEITLGRALAGRRPFTS